MQTRTPAARQPQHRTRMRAIVRDVYGPAEVLRTGEVDVPQIGTAEVLLQVRAAGVDRGAWHLMTGQPYLMRLLGFGVRRPKNLVPGMEVTGVSSTAKTDLVRSLGADHVLDYTREDFLDGATRYDVIIDTGGRNRLPRLRRALAPQGHSSSSAATAAARSPAGSDAASAPPCSPHSCASAWSCSSTPSTTAIWISSDR